MKGANSKDSPSESDEIQKHVKSQPSFLRSRDGNINHNALAYMIAFITLGTAFGNMFLAGKMRNVMKASIPRYSTNSSYNQQAKQHSSSSYSKQQHQQTQEQNQEQYEQFRKQFHNTQQQQQQQYDDRTHFAHVTQPIIETHLQRLNLKITQFNELEIKRAFAILAKTHHPDTLRKDLTESERKQHAKDFHQIMNAYHELLKYLQK
jgi:membrane protein involved in colicin uptake